MSTRAKILLLTIPGSFALVLVFSALLLTTFIESNLENSRRLATLALQQTKDLLLMRLEDASRRGATTRESWVEAIKDDPRLTAHLASTIGQAPSLIEISVAGEDNKIVVSSQQSLVGTPLKPRPSLYELLSLGPIDRLRRVYNSAQDYELRVPIGVINDPHPIFTVQVLVSMTLVEDLIRGSFRWIGVASLVVLFLSMLLVTALMSIVSRDLRRIEQDIDLIRQGQGVPEGDTSPSPEFAAVQSKLSLLGAERNRITAALERLEEGILIFDLDGKLTLAGGAAERLLKRKPETREPTIEPWLRQRRGMPEQPLEWPGPVTLLTAIDFPADSYALVRLRDPEGRRQLELLSRLDAINRLTGGVAHEIKNPLNSIMARLALLESMVDPDSDEAQEELRVIGDEVMRLDRVVRTFLDFTRPVELAQRELDIAALTAEVASMVKPDAEGRGIGVVFDARPEQVMLWGDEDILRQALMNLAVNALDAMPEGGTLRMSVAGGVKVVIADTGVGISPEQKEKIFQLYFTTKKHGSGIGLAMVYRAVQLHGGNIEVDSEPGRGTRFILTFPEFSRT